jgi:hypothetical protein
MVCHLCALCVFAVSPVFYPKQSAKHTAGKPSKVTAGKPWDKMGKKVG